MQPANTRNATSQKFIGLELIRFISALAILFWHYQHFDFGRVPLHSDLGLEYPFYSSLHLFYDNGLQGVRIFWCVSGFIFFWKYKDLISKNLVSGWDFFILRFSRLYPLHLLTLVLVLVLQSAYFVCNDTYFVYQDNNFHQFLLQIFLASNWGYKSSISFNGPIWSISVEVLVYCVFYATFQLGRRWGEYCAFIVLVVALGFNRLLALNGINVAVDFPLADCLVMFFVGGAAATITFKSQNFKYIFALRSIAMILVILVPLLYLKFMNNEHPHTFLFLIVYLPIILYTVTVANFSFSKKVNKLILVLGNLTYSSYLIHFPIQLLIMLIYSYLGFNAPLFSKWFFVSYMLLVLIFSYILFERFEKPAQAVLRKRMLKN